MRDIYYYFLLFFIYCFIGYILEVIYVYIGEKKLINRGFLMGPYLPIYGLGALLISLIFLNKYRSPFIAFMLSIVISSAIEYITSIFLEKIFNRRWWDYSWHKYHINGRICLLNSILFGIGGVIGIYFVNPIIFNALDRTSQINRKVISLILIIIMIIDFIISCINAYRIKVKSE